VKIQLSKTKNHQPDLVSWAEHSTAFLMLVAQCVTSGSSTKAQTQRCESSAASKNKHAKVNGNVQSFHYQTHQPDLVS
jgi:hypothetical protein